MGLGSLRAAIDYPEQAKSYEIRKYAPDILLFANLGAVQLNYGYTLEDCKRAVELVGVVAADAFEVGGYIVPDRASGISIKKRVVDDEEPGAKRAVTRFEVIERLERFTLLRCVPLTGRTNQIRVHLAHAGYPIAGDKLYGRTDEEFLAYVHAVKAGEYDPRPWLEAPRHLLHAARLSFDHPVTRERLCFEAPVPEDMRRFIFEAGSSASCATRP